MAKISVGLLSQFNHECQEWTLYKGRLEQWFMANEITDDVDKSGTKRRAILLSSLAENTYRLIRDLAHPKDVGTLGYSAVIALLDSHFKIKTCGFAERHRFHSAIQEPSESLSQWAARIRGLALNCGFTELKEVLRDRFVLGMANGPERDRLFGEPMEDLSLEKALQLAESVRCAREGSRQSAAAPLAALAGPATPQLVDVHKMAARQQNSRFSSASTSRDNNRCDVCGYSGHSGKVCRYKGYECRKCGAKGHLKRVCKKVCDQHFLQCCSDDGDDGKRLIFNIKTRFGEPMQESIQVDNVRLCFELDTGSAVTAISEDIYRKHFSRESLRFSNKCLQSYNGSSIETLGTILLPFSYKGITKNIEVFVVKKGGPPLLGRDFMAKFKLQLCQINSCNYFHDVGDLTQLYPQLFSDKLGCCKDMEVKLNLKPNSSPIYYKARPVPFALRDKIGSELDRLTEAGIIEPVTFSEYSSPVVPVLKKDGSIRLCADYSVTLNKQLLVDKYPLPRIEELFAKLHGGVQFTKLDLSSAYNQLKLHEDSQMLTCINTHKGLYKYKRLAFGLSCAPAIFQRTLESVLSGIDGVLQFMDDILLTGNSREQHISRLHEVFRRLENAGFVLRKDKCSFFQDSVSYLGFIINKDGLHKAQDKVKAILEAKKPENVTELRSFLGLVNYYRNFVKDASSILCPLHNLLLKDKKWLWENEHELAFQAIKEQLASENTLAHFNPDAKIILTVDASPFGLGAILSQIDKDGIERPVSYMSRSLSTAEKQYSQIQKEATAIIFGVNKFHQYLYGRTDPFILRTDHKPLLSIFYPGKGIPQVSANRLQRYALFLSAYNYRIEYVSSAHNSADFLSRSVGQQPPVDTDRQLCNNSAREGATADSLASESAVYVNFVWQTGSMPLSINDVSRETQLDCTLSQVANFVRIGWPHQLIDKHLKIFYDCRYELAIENGCLMRGSKLIVPNTLRKPVIDELHRGHLGVAKMKSAARDRFWWPGMCTELERAAAACPACAQLRPAPRRAPLTPWPYPPGPWHRVHLDFLGPINNKVYLIAVDAYSKWVEAYDVSSGYGSRVVLEKLCELMSRFGLINTICTDNRTSFVSNEFESFCRSNGIIHLTSPTYHPASNGQAESYVKIVKKAIKTILLAGTNTKDVNVKLNEFLFNYRNSVHSTTNRSPAQVLFGHNLRCRLDLINPLSSSSSDTQLADTVKKNQCLQGKYFCGNRNIDFTEGQIVLVKVNYNNNSVWQKGIVHKKVGKTAYLIKLTDNERIIKRHKNQIYEFKGEESVVVSASTSRGDSQEPQIARNYGESTEHTMLRPFVLEFPEAASETQPLLEAPAQVEPGTSSTPEQPMADPESPEAAAEAQPPPTALAQDEPETDTTPLEPHVLRPRKPIDYKKFLW